MLIKIMTYNVLDGGEDREPLIRQVLEENYPDIVFLQEVTEERLVQNLAAALEMDYFFARGNNIRHLALLSRLPIISPQSYHPFGIRCAILEAAVELDSATPLRLFGVHLAPFVAFYREWWRALEVKMLLRRIESYAEAPCLIAGDFNAIAPDDCVVWVDSIPRWLKWTLWLQGGRVFHYAIARVLAAGFTDCFRLLHPDEPGFTLPTPDPHARLDYIFVNPVLKPGLQQCAVVRHGQAVDRASDHYPVIATFEI